MVSGLKNPLRKCFTKILSSKKTLKKFSGSLFSRKIKEFNILNPDFRPYCKETPFNRSEKKYRFVEYTPKQQVIIRQISQFVKKERISFEKVIKKISDPKNLLHPLNQSELSLHPLCKEIAFGAYLPNEATDYSKNPNPESFDIMFRMVSKNITDLINQKDVLQRLDFGKTKESENKSIILVDFKTDSVLQDFLNGKHEYKTWFYVEVIKNNQGNCVDIKFGDGKPDESRNLAYFLEK